MKHPLQLYNFRPDSVSHCELQGLPQQLYCTRICVHMPMHAYMASAVAHAWRHTVYHHLFTALHIRCQMLRASFTLKLAYAASPLDNMSAHRAMYQQHMTQEVQNLLEGYRIGDLVSLRHMHMELRIDPALALTISPRAKQSCMLSSGAVCPVRGHRNMRRLYIC